MEDYKSKGSSVTVSEVSLEESLSSKPRLQRHPSAQSVLKTDDFWLWEIAGILMSLAALGGIAALLSFLDDRSQPTWAYTSSAKKVGSLSIPAVTVAVSPNTILSSLSTLGRICVLIPITKCLGQLKWVWFAERERQLSDFEAFDNAKSVTGSLILVWRLKFRHLAVIGAAAVLLAPGFDPFVQNLLSYYSNKVVDPTQPALLPRATEYKEGSSRYNLNTEMSAAIISGYSATPNFDVPNYYCASGNCTWESTPTLGVCSRCADVSSLLLRQCNGTSATSAGRLHQCRYTLPNGMLLNPWHDGGQFFRVANSTVHILGEGPQPLVYANYTNPIARMWSIFADGNDVDQYTTWITPKTKMYATECALIPCVQSYHSAVGTSVGGVTTSFTDSVIAEYDTYTRNLTWFTGGYPADRSAGSYLRPKGDGFGNDTYYMSAGAQKLILWYLESTIQGVVQNRNMDGYAPSWSLRMPGSLDTANNPNSFFLQNVFTADPAKTCNQAYHNDNSNWESLRYQCAIENMARAMTVSIRNTASKSLLKPNADFEGSPLIAIGSTMVSTTYIAVTWYWLALPIVLWMMAVIIFIGTVLKTRQAGIRTWRTSTVVPLFLGLGIDDEQKQKVKNLPVTDLQKQAEEIKVQLHLTDEDAKLIGR